MSARVEVAPAFQVYATDALAQAAELSLEEFGALQRLLCVAWLQGGVPADPAALGRKLGVDAARAAALWAVVGLGWALTDDGRYTWPPMEEQRAKQAARRETQRANGARGGRPPGGGKRTAAQPADAPVNPRVPVGLGDSEPAANPDQSFAVVSAVAVAVALDGDGGEARAGATAGGDAEPPPASANDVQAMLATALERRGVAHRVEVRLPAVSARSRSGFFRVDVAAYRPDGHVAGVAECKSHERGLRPRSRQRENYAGSGLPWFFCGPGTVEQVADELAALAGAAGPAVVGTVAGEIPVLAALLVRAANQGLHAHFGESVTYTYRADAHAYWLAEQVIAAGVDALVARDSVFTQVVEKGERDGSYPNSLRYFAKGIVRHAEEQRARADAAGRPEAARLQPTPAGTGRQPSASASAEEAFAALEAELWAKANARKVAHG